MLKLIVGLAIFAPFCFPVEAGIWSRITDTFQQREKPVPPSIRVLIIHDVEAVDLEVKGKYSLYDPYTNDYISSRFIGKNRQIQALSDGLKWGEAFPGLYQIKIKPDSAETITVVDGREYQGETYVYDIGKTISVVNNVPIEHYVKEILTQYENLNLAPETLSALAIVIRTNAYYQAANPKNTYWATNAEKIGYNGELQSSPVIEEALRVTKYMIMSQTGVYEGMATPFAAQFNAKTPGGDLARDARIAKISLEQADQLAKGGDHAAQLLNKAFPGMMIMLIPYES